VAADEALAEAFTRDPPYGAKVTYEREAAGPGWAAPELASWLENGVQTASKEFFSKPAMLFGEGELLRFHCCCFWFLMLLLLLMFCCCWWWCCC
jgi:hypothetical protein